MPTNTRKTKIVKVFSLLNYVGHKSKILDQILLHFPKSLDGVFWDIFSGSCVVVWVWAIIEIFCTCVSTTWFEVILVGIIWDTSGIEERSCRRIILFTVGEIG